MLLLQRSSKRGDLKRPSVAGRRRLKQQHSYLHHVAGGETSARARRKEGQADRRLEGQAIRPAGGEMSSANERKRTEIAWPAGKPACEAGPARRYEKGGETRPAPP